MNRRTLLKAGAAALLVSALPEEIIAVSERRPIFALDRTMFTGLRSSLYIADPYVQQYDVLFAEGHYYFVTSVLGNRVKVVPFATPTKDKAGALREIENRGVQLHPHRDPSELRYSPEEWRALMAAPVRPLGPAVRVTNESLGFKRIPPWGPLHAE